MEIKMLKPGYKNNLQFYEDFLEGRILEKEEYFSEETVFIKEAPVFPIYINEKKNAVRLEKFLKACNVIKEHYLEIEQDTIMNEVFWHSLLCAYKSEELLEEYPQIKEGISKFNKIVLKKLDWENYIYRSIVATSYVVDNLKSKNEQLHYLNLISDNMDLYNYIIKYEIFRNDKFLLNIMDIVDECKLSKILKAKVKNRTDLIGEHRVGRRVIFELNKSYPVILSPTMEKDDLKNIFLKYLREYTIN